MQNITIIGLGYVGWPLAELCKQKGYTVYGVDTNLKRIEELFQKNKGIIFNADNAISNADVIIICVPTPIDKNINPDLSYVKNAATQVLKDLKDGQIIILESTINPGVTEEVVKPILEQNGKKAGVDFYLAHCPERINPGDKKWHVGNIPRVIGAITETGRKKAKAFYETIIGAEIKEMSNVKAAEAVKIVENTFRDVNIAFVNELAKSFDKLKIDVLEVIKGANTKPFAFLAHYPSAGVGGHCIPVDPYYLIEKAKSLGFDHKILKLAREINKSMPYYTVQLIMESLNEIEKSLKGAEIAILGVAYKGGIEDCRESPSYVVIDELKSKGVKLKIYDPYVSKESNCQLEDIYSADVAVILTNHSEFQEIDYSRFKIVIDGKNMLNKEQLPKNVIYKGIGR